MSRAWKKRLIVKGIRREACGKDVALFEREFTQLCS